jgi:hypothetical protein
MMAASATDVLEIACVVAMLFYIIGYVHAAYVGNYKGRG